MSDSSLNKLGPKSSLLVDNSNDGSHGHILKMWKAFDSGVFELQLYEWSHILFKYTVALDVLRSGYCATWIVSGQIWDWKGIWPLIVWKYALYNGIGYNGTFLCSRGGAVISDEYCS